MMSRLYFRILSFSAGNSAVEFALVIWPVLLLVFGTIELSRYYFIKSALEAIAIDTVRCLALEDGSAFSTDYYNNQSDCKDKSTKLQIINFDFEDNIIDDGPNCWISGDDAKYGFIEFQHEFNALFVPLELALPPKAQTITAKACFPLRGAT